MHPRRLILENTVNQIKGNGLIDLEVFQIMPHLQGYALLLLSTLYIRNVGDLALSIPVPLESPHPITQARHVCGPLPSPISLELNTPCEVLVHQSILLYYVSKSLHSSLFDCAYKRFFFLIISYFIRQGELSDTFNLII